MTRALLGLARVDLMLFLRSPSLIGASLVSPLVMGLLAAVLALSVGKQPVGLVQLGTGAESQSMARLIVEDTEAYKLRRMALADADAALQGQQVAAVIVIPRDFDSGVARDGAQVQLFLNNVDADFSNDIRRTVERSVVQFDAPNLGVAGEQRQGRTQLVMPNPYRIAIAEHDLRRTTVGFVQYELVPVLLLLVLNVGIVATGVLVAGDFERGTGRTLLLAPLPRPALLLGRLLGVLAVTAILVGPVLVIGSATGVLGPPGERWPSVLALLLGMALASIGLGLLLGSLVRKVAGSSLVAVTLATYLYFLGGGFATIAFLPDWVQTIAGFVPTSYAIAALRQLLFYPQVGPQVAFDLAVEYGFALVAFVGGALALRRASRFR